MFGFWKKKNIKRYNFFIFDYLMENTKENKIWLKLVSNLYIFKLFIFILKKLK